MATFMTALLFSVFLPQIVCFPVSYYFRFSRTAAMLLPAALSAAVYLLLAALIPSANSESPLALGLIAARLLLCAGAVLFFVINLALSLLLTAGWDEARAAVPPALPETSASLDQPGADQVDGAD